MPRIDVKMLTRTMGMTRGDPNAVDQSLGSDQAGWRIALGCNKPQSGHPMYGSRVRSRTYGPGKYGKTPCSNDIVQNFVKIVMI